jgi:hypothetical protein
MKREAPEQDQYLAIDDEGDEVDDADLLGDGYGYGRGYGYGYGNDLTLGDDPAYQNVVVPQPTPPGPQPVDVEPQLAGVEPQPVDMEPQLARVEPRPDVQLTFAIKNPKPRAFPDTLCPYVTCVRSSLRTTVTTTGAPIFFSVLRFLRNVFATALLASGLPPLNATHPTVKFDLREIANNTVNVEMIPGVRARRRFLVTHGRLFV